LVDVVELWRSKSDPTWCEGGSVGKMGTDSGNADDSTSGVRAGSVVSGGETSGVVGDNAVSGGIAGDTLGSARRTKKSSAAVVVWD